jgi:hypothetical protein
MEKLFKKYNPDIETNFTNKELERKNERYNMTTNIYNPITGIIPSQIKSQNDLLLNYKSDNNLSKLILMKQNERTIQNKEFNTNTTNINTNNTNNTNNNNINTNNNYIQTFEELKNNIKSTNNNIKSTSSSLEKSKGSTDILNQLKDLKIIK